MSNYLFISDAAKEVKVESHVLRYWEEELRLPIKRNELGHRYYTEEDVERFKQIKDMKERGLQLKAIKMILKDGKLNMLSAEKEETSGLAIEIIGSGRQQEQLVQGSEQERRESMRSVQDSTQELQGRVQPMQNSPQIAQESYIYQENVEGLQGSKEEKARRLQWLLQQLIRETLRENNSELCREIKESVVKELDYQFRMQEERDEVRDRMLAERDEAHYKKMDELLRKKSRRKLFSDKKRKGTSA